KDTESCDAFLSQGFNPNIRLDNQTTILQDAIPHGHLDLALNLILCGASTQGIVLTPLKDKAIELVQQHINKGMWEEVRNSLEIFEKTKLLTKDEPFAKEFADILSGDDLTTQERSDWLQHIISFAGNFYTGEQEFFGIVASQMKPIICSHLENLDRASC